MSFLNPQYIGGLFTTEKKIFDVYFLVKNKFGWKIIDQKIYKMPPNEYLILIDVFRVSVFGEGGAMGVFFSASGRIGISSAGIVHSGLYPLEEKG